MRPLFYKSFFFLISIILAQAIIGLDLEFAPSMPEMALINSYLDQKYDVIYFGDSIIKTIDVSDRDTSSIVQMIAKLSSTPSVGVLSHGSYHPGIYEPYLDYISRQVHKPKAVIIPVNLASFSPALDAQPAYQFEKEKFLLTSRTPFAGSFFRPLAIFGVIDANTISWEKYWESPVFYKEKQVGVVRDFIDPKKLSSATPANIRDIYIYRYMYDLHSDHRKLLSLRNAINIAHKAGISVYVYITPVNYVGGDVYVGHDFSPQIERNADIVCAVVKLEDAPCLNLSLKIDDSHFYPSTLDVPDFPSEHLKQAGRAFVAGEVYGTFLDGNVLFKNPSHRNSQ